MAKITEIMETVPYTCRADAMVGDVIRHLMDVQVDGVPIVDEEGRLVGYITSADILRFIAHKKAKIYEMGDMMPVVVDDASTEDKVRELFTIPVIDIATRKKVFTTIDQDIEDVAGFFKKEQVRKLAVLDSRKDGKVVGVVTRSMIIRHLLANMLPD